MNYDNIDQAAAELASFIIPGTAEQIPYKVQQYVQNQYNLSDYEMSVVLDGYYDEEGYVR